MNAEERFEQIKKRQAEQEARYEAEAAARIELLERPVKLPRFVWEELDSKALELSLAPEELLRVKIAEWLSRARAIGGDI